MQIAKVVLLFIYFKVILAQDDITKMIEDSGYPAELHTVVTEDNYVLSLHRIPMRENTPKIALLMHGIHCSAAEFIVTGRSSSLAYLLAENGFDVWLANARGTEFSKQHKTLNSSSIEFWNFSFDEIARYDLPAIIDHILLTTNQSALHYVGHSQGTTAVIAMLSILPTYNEKMITLHLVCPIVFLKHSGIFFRTIAAFSDQIEGAIESMDTGELFPGSPAFRKLLSYFCSKSSPSYQMCKEYMFATVGPSFQWNDDLFIDPKIFDHFPNSVSYKQLIHYGQIIKAGGGIPSKYFKYVTVNNWSLGRFLQFDHQQYKNIEYYNQTTPPSYSLSKVNAKMHFLYGTNDFLSSYLDVEGLIKKFKTSTVGIDKFFGWNHADFLIGREVNSANRKILNVMKQYNGIPPEEMEY